MDVCVGVCVALELEDRVGNAEFELDIELELDFNAEVVCVDNSDDRDETDGFVVDLSNRLNDKEKLEYFCKAILNIDPHHAARYYLTKLDQTVIAPKSVKNTEHNKNNTSTVTSPPLIS